jgi:hypothetical protein
MAATMKDQRICIAVTDRRALGRPIRFVSLHARNGKPTTTNNQPTVGRDGGVRTADRIRYFATAAAARRFLALFPVDHRRLYTLWGPRGAIAEPTERGAADAAAEPGFRLESEE